MEVRGGGSNETKKVEKDRNSLKDQISYYLDCFDINLTVSLGH